MKKRAVPSLGDSPPQKRVRSADITRPIKDKEARRDSTDDKTSAGTRSGSSTPLHAAPPAPAMHSTSTAPAPAPTYNVTLDVQGVVQELMSFLHQEGRAVTNPTQHSPMEGCPSGTINSIRAIHAKKHERTRNEAERRRKLLDNHITIPNIPLDKVVLNTPNHDQHITSDKILPDAPNREQQPAFSQAAIKALQIEMRNMRNEFNDLKSERDEPQKRLVEGNPEQLEQLETLAKDLADWKTTQSRKMESLQSSLRSLHEWKATFLTKTENLEASVRQIDSVQGAYQSDSDKFKAAFSAKIEKLEASTGEINSAQGAYQSDTDNLRAAFSTSLRTAQSETHKWKEAISKQIESLSTSVRAAQSETNKWKAASSSKIETLEALAEQKINIVQSAHQKVESRLDVLETTTKDFAGLKQDAFDNHVKSVESRLSQLKSMSDGNDRQAKEFHALKKQVEELKSNSTKNSDTIKLIQDEFQTVRENHRIIAGGLSASQTSVQELQNTVDAVAKEVPNFFKVELQSLRQRVELELNTALQKMAETSQTTNFLQGQIESTTMAVQSLEKRYENITTESIHQKMVHWITRTYPNAPDFLNELAVMKNDIKRVKDSQNLNMNQTDSKDALKALKLAEDNASKISELDASRANLSQRIDVETNERIAFMAELQNSIESNVKELRDLIKSSEVLLTPFLSLDTEHLQRLCNGKIEQQLCQHRIAIRDINKNLPGGGFAFNFTELTTTPPDISSPYASTTITKGKGRRKG
ncbi:hypothetical protein P280DRAFT_469459 [Massarina eburnea CBS 473.64]|uniref:Uncharacterized protein n=1 Tax=Massarina eburnea CBS 473.64 TaxID=1395130 RepID=A0A6A6S3C1_9PLEO|nr:hypothetical protein P280DRAFT_469459 [Massarina eburnea CBS 473.64]